MTQLVTRKLHACLDYPVALGLVTAPFVLGIGMGNAMAFALSLATGVAMLVMTALTDHESGLLPVLSYRAHLAADGLISASFLVAPFAFGFAGIDLVYFLVVSALMFGMVGLHKDEDTHGPCPAD